MPLNQVLTKSRHSTDGKPDESPLNRGHIYRLSVDDTLTAFATDARNGLSAAEARARLKKNGKNELTPEKPPPVWRKFLAQFQDVLVILLLIATLISTVLWSYERESALPYEAIAIFAVVLLNAIMGYLQQARAEQAVAALRQMSAAHDRSPQRGPTHA